MADYTVDVEPNPDTIDGARCYVATIAGVPMSTVYRGRVGGAVLQEMELRRRGLGATVLVLPAGWAFGSLGGGGLLTGHHTAIDPDAVYTISCIDPAGTDANPWPTISAIAAAITPP